MDRNDLDIDVAMRNMAEEIQILHAISQVSARMARTLFLFAMNHFPLEGETISDK